MGGREGKAFKQVLGNDNGDVVSMNITKTMVIHLGGLMRSVLRADAMSSSSTQDKGSQKALQSTRSPRASALWILSTSCEGARAGVTAAFTFEECTVYHRGIQRPER